MNKGLRILGFALMAFAGAVSAADRGQVTSVLTRDSERLYAVRIVSVDGANLPEGGRNLIRLEPGKRRLGLVALIERDNSFNMRRNIRPQPQHVDIDVEAGKHYKVGAKVQDPAFENWTPVVEFR